MASRKSVSDDRWTHALEKKRLASIERAAALVDVTPRTIRNLIARNELAAVRLGPRLIRVDLDDLERALRPIGGAA